MTRSATLHGGQGQCLWSGKPGCRVVVPREELWSRATAPSHREESAEVARASVSGCPLDASLGRCSRHVPTGRRPQGRPTTRWRDYVSQLAWEHLGIPRKSWRKCLGISAQTAASITR
ncbi:hypothetical protein L3Q82_010177 [Scortum barcoo]|uniref:Uncharacterized protein n=1 Tax=Scortum barcoo TaxID=214431 RepID=A0ACB8WB38_9TELE|nr:hypothetical protein L3Q82_010177 [Scortum barcoo]